MRMLYIHGRTPSADQRGEQNPKSDDRCRLDLNLVLYKATLPLEVESVTVNGCIGHIEALRLIEVHFFDVAKAFDKV